MSCVHYNSEPAGSLHYTQQASKVVNTMNYHKHTLLSVYCFLMGLSSSLSLLFLSSWIHLALLLPCSVIIDYIYLKMCLRDEAFKVGVRATFLGGVFSFGAMIVVLGASEVKVFGLYTCLLSLFHFTEFLAIALTNPPSLCVRSFVLDNGWEYKVAVVCCTVEYFVEANLFPWMKRCWSISCIGFLMCVFGECLRKLAMWTARTNFNHMVQSVHHKGHELVTNGVYHYMRHPSYVGWFIWSVGSQVLLMNPLCMIGYAIVSWWFFYRRVNYEEVTLINFFGDEYLRYQERTGTGLPFIKGFHLSDG